MPHASNQRAPRRLAAAASGVLAGAAGLAVAAALGVVLSGVTSPVVAVADRVVDTSPRPVKDWAIETFGSADKTVLVSGVMLTVALLTAATGLLGLRRPRTAGVILALLSGLALAASVTDRAADAGPALRALPPLALAGVSIGALRALLRPLRRPGAASDAGSSDEGPAALPRRVPGDELPDGFDRRTFLRVSLAVGAVAGAGGLLRGALGGPAATAARAGLRVPTPEAPAPPVPPGATLDVPGITPYLTSNKSFYRVDTALRVPDVPVDSWRLRVHGLVDRELDLSFQDLLSRRLVERRITLTCVSNPVGGEYAGNATWIGVPLRDLLMGAGVRPGADAVKSTSADDFTAGTPLSALLDEERGALVAVAMNGEPLPLEHGFPARMVTPGLYGYVSATKWLVDLEVSRFSDFQAYWTTRGYAERAPIKTSSRIDVPRSFAQVEAGRVPVAGVAWSQNRGIARVEVRVDGGEWSQARLAEEDNEDTWRQWVWHWDATPGNHRLEVRATDRTGYTQTSRRAPVAPDGATGWHSVTVRVS